jgi:hypothetical protein
MCGPADDVDSGPSGPHSRNLCRTPDEADAEDEHAEGQQHCTDVGEINEPVRSFGIGRQNREEKARRNQDRSDGSRTAVVTLATAIPPISKFMQTRAWAESDRVRPEGSAAIVDAKSRQAFSRVVQESVSMPYRDGGDVWINEDSPTDNFPMAHAANRSNYFVKITMAPMFFSFLAVGRTACGAAPPLAAGSKSTWWAGEGGYGRLRPRGRSWCTARQVFLQTEGANQTEPLE